MATVQIDKLLETVVREKVSDLHISTGQPPVVRVSGHMVRLETKVLEPEDTVSLMKSITPERNQQELQEAGGTDFGFAFGDKARFRVAVFKQRGHVGMVLRRIPNEFLTFEQLGLPPIIADLIKRPRGLFLVTGPTGSGKTTSLASMINYLNDTIDHHIITLEDPIEYEFESDVAVISQRAIGRDVPTYERGLRDCLREDPDVIFVGEMTDQESATWTLTAAETGHLVFSGLHTRNAGGTILRLLDMYPSSRADEVANQLSLGLRYILSQKLIARADDRGRVLAMEILNNTFAIANLIRQVKPEQITSMMQTQTRDVSEQRMCTIEHALAVLVKQGKITREDAERNANNPSVMTDALRRLDEHN